MTRTIPAIVSPHLGDRDGLHVVRIVELTPLTGPPLYFSDRVLAAPVAASGGVTNWGSYSMSLRDGKGGGNSSTSVSIADSVNALGPLFAATRGGANRWTATVYAWVPPHASAWPGDAIVEFAGRISSANYDESSFTWDIAIEDNAVHADKDIGILIDRDVFAGISCNECAKKIIPVAYGNPVYRVPVCPIDEPGRAVLVVEIGICDTAVEINVPAGDAGFAIAQQTSIAIGTPGDFEIFNGQFANSAATTFDLIDGSAGSPSHIVPARGHVLVKGSSKGTYAEGGVTWMTIDVDDLPTQGVNLNGHVIVFPDTCESFVLSNWASISTETLAIMVEPVGVTFPSAGGLDYMILAQPGYVPVWPPGTAIWEMADYVFAANSIPSNSVVRVEGLLAGRGNQQAFAELSPVYYTVNLNDKTYNTAIDRSGADDGLTTITLHRPPLSLGFQGDVIYVTLTTPVSNPVDVVEDLAFNAVLGGLDAAVLKDAAAFTSASAAVTGSLAFALDKEKKLDKLVTDIAAQSGFAVIWDQGRMVPIALSVLPASGGDLYDENNCKEGSLSIEERGMKDVYNRVEGKFRFTIPGRERRVIRQSQEAIDDFDESKHTINFGVYQDPNTVAEKAGFWCQFRLNAQREIKLTTFLEGIAVRPGDSIVCAWVAGDGVVILPAVDARVTSVQRREGSNQYDIKADANLYAYAVVAVGPIGDCEEQSSPVLPPPDESGFVSNHFGLTIVRASPVIATASRPGGGGGCSTKTNKIYVSGRPTSGDFTFRFNIDGTDDDIVFTYNDTASSVTTKMQAHASLSASDFTVNGGPFPHLAIYIDFDSSKILLTPSLVGNSMLANAGDAATPIPKLDSRG